MKYEPPWIRESPVSRLTMDFESIARQYNTDFKATFTKTDEEAGVLPFTDFAQKWNGYIKQHFHIMTDREINNRQVCYGVAYVINERNKQRYSFL